MKYQQLKHFFDIDLNKPESARWEDVQRDSLKDVKRLVTEARRDLSDPLVGTGMALKLVTRMVAARYRYEGGLYLGEIYSWADALGRPRDEMIMLNCLYEVSHTADFVLGCTAAVKWSAEFGMSHVRTLDWPLKNIGPATRVVRLIKGERKCVVVAVAGFVGALSGMVPGAYSVSINWAPPSGLPAYGFSPPFLLRHVLETCDTYQEALAALRDTRLSTSVFYVLCGAERGQGCIIERTADEAVVKRLGKRAQLIQTNHYQTAKFWKLNEDRELLMNSHARRDSMNSSMMHTGPLEKTMSRLPVRNEDTHQKIIFFPGSGAVTVYASKP